MTALAYETEESLLQVHLVRVRVRVRVGVGVRVRVRVRVRARVGVKASGATCDVTC